jgi:hypothetical protein
MDGGIWMRVVAYQVFASPWKQNSKQTSDRRGGGRGRGRKLAIGGQGLLSESVRLELGSCCIKKIPRTHAVPQAKLSPLGVPKTSITAFLTCENLHACVLGCDGGLISLFFFFVFWGDGRGAFFKHAAATRMVVVQVQKFTQNRF